MDEAAISGLAFLKGLPHIGLWLVIVIIIIIIIIIVPYEKREQSLA